MGGVRRGRPLNGRPSRASVSTVAVVRMRLVIRALNAHVAYHRQRVAEVAQKVQLRVAAGQDVGGRAGIGVGTRLGNTLHSRINKNL